MKKMTNIAPSFRGVAFVRADATGAEAKLNELHKAFDDFKVANDKKLADIEKGRGDVVQTEQVDRINAAMDKMTAELDALNQKVAAAQIGGDASRESAEVKAHKSAFNEFFRRGVDNDLRALEVKAALTTQSDPVGGYLVPAETEAGIDRVLGKTSVIRSLARVIPISGGQYKKLTSVGGATSGWGGEEEARSETNTPQLREIAIEAKELYANPAVTQTALDDARFNIESWLAEEVSIEFAEQEGLAFANGDGVKQPHGIFAYDAVASASHVHGKLGYVVTGKASGFADASSSSSPADALIDLYYSLKQGYRNEASWLMNDATMASVRKFKDGDGAYIWAPPTAAAEVATILSKPVYTDDNIGKVEASALPIAFGNFKRGYLIVDRMGVRVLRDPYTRKPFVQFYTTKRVGGGVVDFDAIKLLKVAAS